MSCDRSRESGTSFPEIYKKVYSHSALVGTLRGVDVASVILVATAYAAGLAYALVHSVIFGIEVLSLSALPFIFLSLFRKKINAPRPYELYDFISEGIAVPGHTGGKSFPSRHVFSAMLIGGLYCFFCLPVGITVLALGLLLSVCRVLLGIHFIRDVVAGGLIGVILGCGGGVILILV